MQRGVKITILFIIFAVVGIFVVDGILLITFGENTTISVVIAKYSHNYPVIPLLAGALIGHLFLQNND